MKEIKPRYKYRFVQQFGKLKQANGEWYFTANPMIDCPVRLLSNRSKWCIVETVFVIIVILIFFALLIYGNDSFDDIRGKSR